MFLKAMNLIKKKGHTVSEEKQHIYNILLDMVK